MILNTRDNNKKVYVSESQLASLGNASDDGRYSRCGFEMLVGIPGCGKSTYLKKVDSPNVLIVCPDDIRRELTGNISDQSRNGDVWSLTDKRIGEGLKSGRYVILDATNVGTRNRVNMLNKIKTSNPGISCYATVFDCNPEVSKQRIASDIENGVDRSNVPADVIDRMYSQYLETLEVIKDEGFDDVFYYGGSNEGRILTEAEWNMHINRKGWYDKHTLEPYMTDNKFAMIGRGTGHFGSGTYFSTYKNREDYQNALKGSMCNSDPHFIEIGDKIYRVDFDLYKNLYRVWSYNQGCVLFTMLKLLNIMYNGICNDLGKFKQNKAHYDNADLYQKIKKNADGLGLKCPSYYQLTRMAQEHGKNNDAPQSFSTVFMEWNGYNGVNVSGIEEFDNTTHGSVIYDLSKVNTDMEQVRPKNVYTGRMGGGWTNSVVKDGFDDIIYDSLMGDRIFISTIEKMNEMPLPQAMRILKNYCDSGNVLDAFLIEYMNDDIAKRYIRLLYAKSPNNEGLRNSITFHFFDDYKARNRYAGLIEKYGAYYWVNFYKVTGHYYNEESGKAKEECASGLILLLEHYGCNFYKFDEEEKAIKKQYLNKLLGYMTRELTETEKEYIEEGFLYVYNSSDDK